MIVVVGFPEFGSYTQVIVTITRYQLLSAYFVPLLSRCNTCCPKRVYTQANRRAPGHGVFNKFHLLAVVGKKKGTRALQALLGYDFLIGLYFKVSADGAVGPGNTYHIRTRLFTETEVKHRSGNRLLLHQQAGADFYFAADAERVYALIADSIAGTRPHDLPVIVFSALIDCLYWPAFASDAQQIKTPAVVNIGDVKHSL